MMTISEMKERKKKLRYTNEDISEKTGLPLSTVQKVFCGATKNPRYSTLEALEKLLKEPSSGEYELKGEESFVKEEALAYQDENDDAVTLPAKKIDCWIGLEPSEKWPRQGEYTVAYIESLPDDVRVELIDGYIYDLASPGGIHQFLVTEIYTEFRKCIEEHGQRCLAFVAPFDVALDGDNRTKVQPDILIMCERTDEEDERNKEVPDLVTEVLSDSTRQKDVTIKLRKYMTAGVKEYWIVDPKTEKVVVYLFDEGMLPYIYSFDDKVPIGISGGEYAADFGKISARLREVRAWDIPGVDFD